MPPSKVLLRSRLSYVKPGVAVSDADYDMLLTGEVDVYKPDGERLCCVRRQVVSSENRAVAREVLLLLRGQESLNRGAARGAPRFRRRKASDGTYSRTTESDPAPSAIIGFFDRYSRIPYCRQTAFNACRGEDFERLGPTLQELDRSFAASAPERYAAQTQRARSTSPDFVIPGTAWTTITVNHNWATCTHLDKGDLKEGFSCLAVLRRGSYRGGVLVFPAYRVGVDLGDGDLIMMDAHEYHANTPFTDTSDDYERISMVLYYREKMIECGSAAEELARAKALRGSLISDDGEAA